jgi:Mrp family chromosome partitioning ATPase
MLSRIETINRTTAQIMAGDLGRRIVVEGSGDEFDALATNLNAMLALLREQYDQVVVDSPPVLLVSDPKATSELVDATIFLVRWQETSADKAQNALDELDGVNAKVAGVVLAQVDTQRQEQYGYAGVGSYYKNYRKYYVD